MYVINCVSRIVAVKRIRDFRILFHVLNISADRFLAVTRPISYATRRNGSARIRVTLALTWIVSIMISSPIALGANYTADRLATPTACTFYNADFIIYSSMGSFYIPCCAMLLLYWRVFRVINERVRSAGTHLAATGSRNMSSLSPPVAGRQGHHMSTIMRQLQVNTVQYTGAGGMSSIDIETSAVLDDRFAISRYYVLIINIIFCLNGLQFTCLCFRQMIA